MRDRLIASGIITAAVAVAAPAFGQEGRPAQANTTAAASGGSGGQSAAPAPDTRALMQADGGSLLQASVPAAADDAGAGAGGAGTARTPSYSLYAVPDADPHVLKKHDLVNIVVREQSNSVANGNSDQQRQSLFDAKVDAFVRFKPSSLSLYGLTGSNLPEAKLEGQRTFQGTGEYDRTDSMTTRLEAEVIDVKPNGTLVIQARRHMRIDEEEINVALTGVCRVQDVDATNSVLSTDMHDLDLQKTTRGEVHDTTERSLIHRFLDFINPF